MTDSLPRACVSVLGELPTREDRCRASILQEEGGGGRREHTVEDVTEGGTETVSACERNSVELVAKGGADALSACGAQRNNPRNMPLKAKSRQWPYTKFSGIFRGLAARVGADALNACVRAQWNNPWNMPLMAKGRK